MQLRFRNWVDKYGGIGKLAETLGVGEHAVRIWLRGDGCPRVHLMYEIIELSKRELTFSQIFKETTRGKSCQTDEQK